VRRCTIYIYIHLRWHVGSWHIELVLPSFHVVANMPASVVPRTDSPKGVALDAFAASSRAAQCAARCRLPAGVSLACSFLGVCAARVPSDACPIRAPAGVSMSSQTHAIFEYRAGDRVHEVAIRCDNLASRRVPPPPSELYTANTSRRSYRSQSLSRHRDRLRTQFQIHARKRCAL